MEAKQSFAKILHVYTVAADVLWGQAPQTYQPTITELAATRLLSFLKQPQPKSPSRGDSALSLCKSCLWRNLYYF